MRIRSRADAKAAVAGCALLALGSLGAVGCSSEDPTPPERLGETAAPLRTCAKGGTLTGIDVSYYQGTVDWAKVKGDGRTFAFARASDGLNYPDTKFAQNWPAMKSAGVIRGVYQYFRPSQDPAEQADLMLDKIKAAGGLQPGDLPPVLDLETASGLSSSVVVARAKTWLAAVEKAIGQKPIVYTAAFMSDVIGSNFSGYTLWVANYEATCPYMPSGWTDWHFWQNSDSGSVDGVGGNVDTNLFNGSLKELKALTLKPANPNGGGKPPSGGGDFPTFEEPKAKDGSQGSTMGEGAPKAPASTPPEPCASKP